MKWINALIQIILVTIAFIVIAPPDDRSETTTKL